MLQYSDFYEIPRVVTVHSLCTAFHERRSKDFYFGGETHNFWELVFISEGRAGVAKDEKIYNLSAGDIAFHRPMEFHRLWSVGEPFRVLVISFHSESRALEPLADGIFSLSLAQQTALFSLKQLIDNTFTLKGGYMLRTNGESPLALQTAVSSLELFLLDVLKMETPEKEADTSRTAQEFARVIEIMNEYIGLNLSVPELAQLAQLSVSNLKRICQKYAATGPAKHFMRLKMIHATQLLAAGQSVGEVSEQLGFSGQNYFSYVFRREMGESPTAFKADKMKNTTKGM